MKLHIAVLPGDGVGPEVVKAGLTVLSVVSEKFGHELAIKEHLIGWTASQTCGDPLPVETVAACVEADAVLLGAVGDPAADGASQALRPESGLLRLRKELGCFANLRPARMSGHLLDSSPLRADVVRGTDLIIVRELAGGIYYGPAQEGSNHASNTMEYTADEIRRVARIAFEWAQQRRRDVVSVDKANVLAVSRLWRSVVDEIAADYPEVKHSHMLVDRAAMELVFRPASFDVVVTANLFGDILSDQAAALVGSIGMLSSASIGGQTDLYEPVHGSAPDIARRDIVNPIGAITSIALMLRHTFGLTNEAQVVDDAVDSVLAQGFRTADILGATSESVGTNRFSELVAAECAADNYATAANQPVDLRKAR